MHAPAGGRRGYSSPSRKDSQVRGLPYSPAGNLGNALSPATRKTSLFLASLAFVLLALPGISQATFPGQTGLLVFLLTTDQPGSAVAGGLYAIGPRDEQPRQLTANPYDV